MGIMKLKTAVAPLVFSLLAGTTLSAHAAWYMTDIGAPFGGSTSVGDINDKGQIVGYTAGSPGAAPGGAYVYENGSATLYPSSTGFTAINNKGEILGSGGGTYSAYVFQNGQTTSIPSLGGGNVFAYGINDSGQVIGMSNHAGTTWLNAFIYSNGTTQDYGGLPGAISTYAYSINNSGAFTGVSFVNGAHSFIYQNGSMTDLGSLGGDAIYAQAINNANQVVGWTTINSTDQAFLYSNGTLTNITAQAGLASGRATDINDRGQIIGTTGNGDAMQSFLYSNGSLTNLSTLPEVVAAGWSQLWARAINNLGDIVGVGLHNGVNQAFVLSPNHQFAAPTITVASFAAPEIDGNGALMGLALLGGLLSLMRRKKTQSA